MSSWKDDPELVRQNDDDELLQKIELEDRWSRLFTAVEQIFVGDGGGFVRGTWRAMFKGFLWQAKKRVAIDPDGSRSYVIESMQLIAACLEIEPRELYPDLKPKPEKEPAVA
jgi:hypothetical protein